MSARDFDFDENKSYTTMDLCEDVEDKIEELIVEKIDIHQHLMTLMIQYSEFIDPGSFNNIKSFMDELFDEVTHEQIVLNDLIDYLYSKVDELTPEELEYGSAFTEYKAILDCFSEIEDIRVDEYVAYTMKIAHLLRTQSVSASFLDAHRKFPSFSYEQAIELKNQIPSIKK